MLNGAAGCVDATLFMARESLFLRASSMLVHANAGELAEVAEAVLAGQALNEAVDVLRAGDGVRPRRAGAKKPEATGASG